MMGYIAFAVIFLGLMFVGMLTAAAFDLME
jgi:hypothetical protein